MRSWATRPSVASANRPSVASATARRWRALTGALLVLGLAGGVLAGCSADPNSVAEQARTGDRKGYVSGDGTSEQIPPGDRGEPVRLAGATIDGGTFDLAGDAKGKVVVVNVWGSWCPPCVAETPDLQRTWSQLEPGGQVQFLGINFREGRAAGQAFASKAGVTFPSLSDQPGIQLLNLQGKAPTTPSTLVLDRQHRIAARVNGPVNESLLKGLVADVVAES